MVTGSNRSSIAETDYHCGPGAEVRGGSDWSPMILASPVAAPDGSVQEGAGIRRGHSVYWRLVCHGTMPSEAATRRTRKTLEAGRSMKSRWIPLIFVVAATASSRLFAEGTVDDERFLAGLCERRLFRLAELHCQNRLATSDLSTADRAALVTELIRTLAAHAVNSRPEERAELWQQAHAAAAEYRREHAADSRLVLVRVQAALADLARGELARQEAEIVAVASAAAERRTEAQTAVRQAIRSLDQIDGELVKDIPQRERTKPRGDELTADELRSVRHNVQYQLARAFRNQALTYPPGSADRVAGLTQAVERLDESLTQIDESNSLHAPIRVERAICRRYLGDPAAARQELAAIESSNAPAAIRLQARAEIARCWLDARQSQSALQAIERGGRTLDGRASSDLDLAILETQIALWKAAVAANDGEQTKSWRDKAVATTKFIEQQHGGFWGRRGDLLLIAAAGRSELAGDAEILTRAADDLFRKGELADAAAAYERAAAAAGSDADLAFQLRYKSALVHQQRKDHAAAAAVLREFSMGMSQHKDAAKAHLLAAWNAAQAARTDNTLLADYAELLDEHLRAWPSDPTIATAGLWLGKLKEGQRDWPAAAAAFLRVPHGTESFDEALRGAVRCQTARLEGLQTANEPTADDAKSAAAALLAAIRIDGETWPEKWTATDRFAVESAARVWLRFTDDQFAAAEDVLQRALQASPPPDAAWRATARALLVVALAGQPSKRAEAESLLSELGGGSPAELLPMLDSLTAIARRSPAAVRRDLANLQLAVIDKLLPAAGTLATLSPADARKLAVLQAQTLAVAERSAEATAAFAELARRFPDDGSIQQQYAELLSQSRDPASLNQALEQWRVIAARSPAQSDRWYRAKHAIALALLQLGRPSEAADRIRYLQTVPPGIADESWKTQFADLLRRCEAAKKP